MATSDQSQSQTFSFETVAVLVAAIQNKGAKIGMGDYHLMAKLDGVRTASSFDHQFRKVKKRATELMSEQNTGGEGKAKAAVKERTKEIVQVPNQQTPKIKRGRKAMEEDVADTEDEEPGTKKIKKEDAGESSEDGEIDSPSFFDSAFI